MLFAEVADAVRGYISFTCVMCGRYWPGLSREVCFRHYALAAACLFSFRWRRERNLIALSRECSQKENLYGWTMPAACDWHNRDIVFQKNCNLFHSWIKLFLKTMVILSVRKWNRWIQIDCATQLSDVAEYVALKIKCTLRDPPLFPSTMQDLK